MIRVLEIREYIDNGERKGYRKPIGINAESLPDLFMNLEGYMNQIPKEERYNLHYSIAHWNDGNGKEFDHQEVLPLDLDGIDNSKHEEYISVVSQVVEIPREEMGIVASGNGLHFLIGLNEPITDPAYFKATAHHYKALCGRIAAACFHAGLMVDVDSMSWQTGKSLRLPNTLNIKPDKGEKKCLMVNPVITKQDVDITKLSALPVIELEDQINPVFADKMPIDTKGVLTCPFLQYCGANPDDVSEPQWYASISILARLERGHQLVHKYSEGHRGYNEEATNNKIEQSLQCSGPRTCGNISTLWEGCAACEHFKTITSPIQLTSKEFIKTESTGFYNMVIKNNIPVKGKPNYDDLAQHFANQHTYCTIDDSKTIMVYDGTMWEHMSNNQVRHFAEIHFDPSPDNKMCNEFEGKLQRSVIKPSSFFNTIGKVNFENGWLDMDSMDGVLNPHSEGLGFLYKLPFRYNAEADCPRFKKFIEEVTCGEDELATILYEFMGYTFSGADPDIGGKALIMVGDGSNGKSVLVDVICSVVGNGNYSVTNLRDAVSKPEARANMTGKLLNISEETPSKALMDSSTFKNLVTGGEVESRRLYDNSISMKNIAKLIMTCNEMPTSTDLSYGMRRRLLIIPFDAVFSDTLGNRDPFLREKLLKELPGIFNLCFRYYNDMKKRGHFTVSQIVKDKVQEYIEDGSSVAAWIGEANEYEITRNTNDIAPTDDVYAAYKRSCISKDIKEETYNYFGRQLKGLGIRKRRRMVDGERINYYIGIREANANSEGTADTGEDDF